MGRELRASEVARRRTRMTADQSEAEVRLGEALLREVAARSAGQLAESALRAVVDGSPLPIVSLDLDGRVTSWNSSAERVFGWTADEVLGKPSPTVPDDGMEESDATRRDVLSGNAVTGLRRRRLRKDGSVVVVNISTAPLHDESGRIRGTVVIAEDISQQDRDEEERSRLLARERAARGRAEDAAARLERLQHISAGLSRALTPSEVGDVILTQGMESLGASAASISRLDEESGTVQIVASSGYPDDVLSGFARFPIDSALPLAYSIRTGEPVWLQSPDNWDPSPPEVVAARASLHLRASASIPLLFRGKAFGALGLSFREARTFSDEDKSFILALAQQCAQALERSRLYDAEHVARADAESSRQKFEFLAQASITLSSSLDYFTTLATVARLAVPHIADWCSVYIVDDSGEAHLLAVAHVDPEKVELAQRLHERFPPDPNAGTGVHHVMRTSEPELIPYIPDDLLVQATEDPELLQTLRELGLVSAMTVPLVARGRVLGAITLVSAESDHRYGEDDLALASDLAGRAAVAVDNARLLRETQQGALEREAILGQIADGIVMADASGKVVFANAAAIRLLGTAGVGTPASELSEKFHAFAPSGEPLPSEDFPLVRAALRNETIANQDVFIRRADGTELVIECSATPVISDEGRKLGAVVSFRDVTSHRTLERQKDDFLSAAAHDLKTPLTTIKGLAQILARRAARANTPETNSLIEGLNRIDATSTRMSGLINELLDVSRIQLGRPLDLIRSETDLVALLRHIASEQQHTTEQHEIVVETEVDELIGNWDAVRLDRAFTNLVVNAITYSPAGGRVTIAVARDPGISPRATVRVDDEGLGVPDDDLPHIFERFHRGSNVAGRIPGTGIGLAGAREIFRQHGGTISVRRRPLRGSSFEVTLPLEPDAGSDDGV